MSWHVEKLLFLLLLQSQKAQCTQAGVTYVSQLAIGVAWLVFCQAWICFKR